MSKVTQKELAAAKTLVGLEAALHEKFTHYAEECSEEHVTKLCRQLAVRSRQHLTALIDGIDHADTPVQ